MRRSSKGRDMITRYISNRVMGMNKTASARNAGYKQPNSVVTTIEKSNNFREITSEILASNSVNAIKVIKAINDDINAPEFRKISIQDKVDMLSKLANIQKALSPDLRIKETIDDKGKVTRTMWNTASPMQSQNILAQQEQSNVAQSTFDDTQNPLINIDISDTKRESVASTPTAQT